MLNLNPIKIIKGLFNHYRDNEVVPASEYNANITLLKQAIEHNGEILNEHQQQINSFLNQTIPVDSITTEKIQDDAITPEKLSEEVLTSTLLTSENVNALYGDLIPQLHKQDLGIYGAFMNGSITEVNKTLKNLISYTRSTEHGACTARVYLTDDKVYGDTQVTNHTASFDYKTDIYLTDSSNNKITMYDFNATWKTTYDLDKEYNLKVDPNTFEFIWYAYRGVNLLTGSATIDSVEFLDKNRAVIAVQKEYLVQNTVSKSIGNKEYCGIQLKFSDKAPADTTVDGVRHIVITHTAQYEHTSSRGITRFGDSYSPLAPVFSISATESTGAEAIYQSVYDAIGSQNRIKIGVRVSVPTDTTVNFEESNKLQFSVLCTGDYSLPQIGSTWVNAAYGTSLPVQDYISPSADMEYTVTKEDDTTYYITQEFQAPVILSALVECSAGAIEEMSEKHMFEDLIYNTYDSFIKSLTSDKPNYIVWCHKPQSGPVEYLSAKDALELYEDFCTEATGFNDQVPFYPISVLGMCVQSFNIGTNVVDIKIASNLTNITIESVSVARYNSQIPVSTTTVIPQEVN